MNVARRILKNFLSLLSAGIVTNLLGFVAIVYLARVLGPGDFGKISFTMAIVTYFTLIANMGLPLLGTREVARNKTKIKDYTGSILTLRLCLAFLGFGLLLLMALFLNKPLEIKYLIILYGLGLIPSALLLDWAFQGVERMEYIGLGHILASGIYLGLVFWFVKSSEQLLLIPCFLVASNLLVAGLLIFIFVRNFGKPRFRFNLIWWKSLLRQALPIGLTGIMSTIILYLDTIMLGVMKSDEVVGYYNAAYKIIFLLIMVIATYHDAIFPVISNYYKTSLDSLRKLQSYSTKLMVTLALPLAVGGTILARPIINLLYGAEYEGGIIALQILIWAGALSYINTAYSRGLWACNKQDTVLRIVALHATIAVILNFILIPPFGLVGASIATVVGGIVALLMYYRALGKIITVPIHNYIFKPLLASVIMGLLLWLAPNWNVFLLVFGGALIYLALFYLIRGVTREEITLIRSAMPGGKN